MELWELYYRGVPIKKFESLALCQQFVDESFLPSEKPEMAVTHGEEEFVMVDGVISSKVGRVIIATVPTPGSGDAAVLGCTCPVIDNHHGRGFILDGKLCFWYSADCPIHKESSQDIK